MSMIDDNSIGEFSLDKGLIRKDARMMAWDGIRECTVTECPVHDICRYLKRGKCGVLVQYLKSLYDCILTNYTYLDDVSLFKIGMQIVPLYLQLAKMQLLEMSLVDMILTDDKGNIKIHPIYSEIRKTLTTVHLMWKDLELSVSFGGKPDPKKAIGGEEPIEADPEYYEKMSKKNHIKKGVIR